MAPEAKKYIGFGDSHGPPNHNSFSAELSRSLKVLDRGRNIQKPVRKSIGIGLRRFWPGIFGLVSSGCGPQIDDGSYRLVTHFKFFIVGPDQDMVTKRP